MLEAELDDSLAQKSSGSRQWKPKALWPNSRKQELPDQHGSWGVFREEIGGRRRDQGDTKRFQEIMPGELYRQVAGKSIWAFHDDAADTIAGNPVEHSLEAGPLGDWIATAHSRVIELINDGVAVSPPVTARSPVPFPVTVSSVRAINPVQLAWLDSPLAELIPPRTDPARLDASQDRCFRHADSFRRLPHF